MGRRRKYSSNYISRDEFELICLFVFIGMCAIIYFLKKFYDFVIENYIIILYCLLGLLAFALLIYLIIKRDSIKRVFKALNKEILDNEHKKIIDVYKKIDDLFNCDDLISDETFKKFVDDIDINLIPFSLNISFSAIPLYFKYRKEYRELADIVDKLDGAFKNHNEKILNNRIEIFNKVCSTVEGKVLDDDQVKTIIRDSHNQLVVAGAGCGKTTTIVGKVKYLVKGLNVNPSDILLLSFTRKSASDMKMRVESEIGTNMECYTFHKLGLEIIKQELKDVSIYDGNLHGFIKEEIKKLIQNEDYLYALIYFLTENIHLIKDEFSIKSEEEYKNYIEINPPTTIKGEIVNSYGEL